MQTINSVDLYWGSLEQLMGPNEASTDTLNFFFHPNAKLLIAHLYQGDVHGGAMNESSHYNGLSTAHYDCSYPWNPSILRMGLNSDSPVDGQNKCLSKSIIASASNSVDRNCLAEDLVEKQCMPITL